MSASLVGSEMCIRDRASIDDAYRPPQHARVLLQVLAGRLQEDQLVLRGTVSYTHLTLPTICSV
eukprot:6214780-Alexandrium_andersonii.AAC.1